MKYISTRNASCRVSGSEAILMGISPEGGLFVPETFPQITLDEIKAMGDMSYAERSALVMSRYLDEFSEQELLEIANRAYARFDDEDACPLTKIEEDLYILELWHGPTYAFKDVALTVLPQLISACRAKRGEKDKTLVLVATSGDTGKAALEGFKDVEGTEIMVFYPDEGVAHMQKLQMITTGGDNTYVAGIKGNFDDAQTAVKKIFTDQSVRDALKEGGYVMSSANSINWGRLLPQIAYYFSAYADLLSSNEITVGDKVNFAVPTGNFGDILAGYYAMRMGLPVNKLVCASNINNVLTDFFTTGEYDATREFHKTISPSMDILISSNLERLLFEYTGRDDKALCALMDSLKKTGKYQVDPTDLKRKLPFFEGGFADEDETMETIYNTFDEYGYVVDPHTAVAVAVYNDYYLTSGDTSPAIVLSTANPYKFAQDVYEAVGENYVEDPFKAVKKLHFLTGMDVPEGIRDLETMEPRFTDVLSGEEIKQKVLAKVKG
ncbi:MAG TPA: threonine synthase [Clostridiales bacterium]|nr:threonine synthase [Clostridiales bacterium]